MKEAGFQESCRSVAGVGNRGRVRKEAVVMVVM
jgi:hypothetical protein